MDVDTQSGGRSQRRNAREAPRQGAESDAVVAGVASTRDASNSVLRGVQLLQRAFVVLRALSMRNRVGWRLSELAAYCQLHHSTTYRVLAGLIQEEMVERDPQTRRYRLGRLAFEFGVAAAAHCNWQEFGADALDRIATYTGDTVFFNLRSGHESVCIDRREGHYPLKALTVEVGARRPLCVSAGGAAILGLLEPAEFTAVLRASEPYMERFAASRAAAVRRMLSVSRRLGYGYNREMIIPGVRAIGVAVRGPEGEPIAALSVAATAQRLMGTRRVDILRLLQHEAAAIENKLVESMSTAAVRHRPAVLP